MSSSPWEKLRNGDEDVATSLHAGQCRDAPAFGEDGFRSLPEGQGSGMKGVMFPRVPFVRSRVWFGWMLAVLGLSRMAWLEAGTFEPLVAYQAETTEVARLGRVRSLMASSGPTNRPVVRVVFYGQSRSGLPT